MTDLGVSERMAAHGRDDERVRLTMAQALVRFLSAQYSERDGERTRLVRGVFGIFGHGNVAGLGQALIEYGAALRYYQPRNEQAMVHTAIGFAKSMRRRATFACTSSIGPGATNMVTGAATATINRLPVLLLPGDYYATRLQGDVLQQLEHPVSGDASVNDCLRPVSRYFDRITRPEQLLAALPEAMRVLTDPVDTGAVTLALPQDVQSHAYDFPARFLDERVWRIERRAPDPGSVDEAVGLLRAAERPVLIAGGGVIYAQAEEELRRFADAFGIPVSETSAGKGAMGDIGPLALGGAGVTGTGAAAAVLRDADLVICVGTRLTDFTTGSRSAFQHPDVRFVSVNVARRDAHKLGALAVVADAREALRALHGVAAAAGVRPREAYVAEAGRLKEAWAAQVRAEVRTPVAGEAMSQGRCISILNEEARRGDVVVAAAGSAPSDLLKLWDTAGGRACHLEFGYSCMGYEIPAALGVRLAQPAGEVYVLVGDGTYLMNPTELVTATQEGLKVTIVLLNNGGYQVIRQLQLNRVGRSFGNEFRARSPSTGLLEGDYLDVDYAANAESLGARAWRVATEAELRSALAAARAETRPCVIEVELEKHRFAPGSGMWWDVAPAEATTDAETERRRAEYERARAAQRYYG